VPRKRLGRPKQALSRLNELLFEGKERQCSRKPSMFGRTRRRCAPSDVLFDESKRQAVLEGLLAENIQPLSSVKEPL